MLRLYQIIAFLSVWFVFQYVWKECKGLKYRKMLIPVLLAQLWFITIGYFYLSIPVITYLLIGGVGIPALISGMVYDPNILLIVASAYLPFTLLLPGLFGGIGVGFNLTNIVLLSLFVGLFLGKKRPGDRLYTTSRVVMSLLAAYIVLSLMSYVKGSLYFGTHYLRFFIIPIKRWLTPIIVFYLFYKLIRDKDIIKIIFSIILIGVIINILYGMLQWVQLGLATYTDFYRRLTGINGHPNFYSAFLAYYLCLIAGPMLYHFKKNSGRFLLFPFLLGIRVIVPTNSRGGWVALAAAIPTLSFFRSKLTFFGFAFLVFLAFIFPDYLIPNTVRARVEEATRPGVPAAAIYTVPGPATVLSESKSISMRTRWMLLEAGLQLARENIWFGSGWGVYPFRIGDYNPDLKRASAHNIWMQILCEMGLLTLIAVLLMLFFLFKSGLYVLKRERDPMLKGMALGFVAAIPAILVANMTGNRFDAEDLMYPFWILAACVLQLKNILVAERTGDDSRIV